MSVPSVVFQVYSEQNGFGVDMAIAAAAVVRVLNDLGISAVIENEGSPGTVYSVMYGVPIAAEGDSDSCEVLIRAWPADSWPLRPNGVRTVVDFVRYPDDRSRAADFTVALEDDGTDPDTPGLIRWDVLFPLPIEVNQVTKEIVESTILIHLGQDVGDRLVALRAAIHGFDGMSALGLRYPDGDESAGIVATATPWEFMASGDVAIATADFPVRLTAALRIPTVLVAETPEQEPRCLELTSRGHNSFLYLGMISGMSDATIRDAARDLRNDETLKRVLRLGGNDQRWAQGIKRFADWVGRELVGKGLHQDPYLVKGYETVFDPLLMLPLNASNQAEASGATEEEEVQVEMFTVDGTWTKPDGARFVNVRLISAGSGGGSGSRGPAASDRGGGGGGCGGTAQEATFPAESLPSSVAVVVGAGGAGGAAQTVDNSNGFSGTAGTASSFGDFLHAVGGSAGAAGQTLGGLGGAGGVAGAIFGTDTNLGPGGDGGIGSGTGGPAAVGDDGNLASAGGGGGGGGIDAADVNDSGNNGGGGSLERATPFAGGASSIGEAGESASALGNVQGGGGGGGGGGAISGDPGTAGGAGGFPGGGGGGGGASFDGQLSGAGGTGGNGLVVVTTFF